MTKFLFSILIILLAHNPAYAQQDCDVLNQESDNFTIGFKAGGLFYGVGPEVSWGSSSGTPWTDNLQYFVAEYQELCSRYNTGRISDAEYKKEFEAIVERSRGYTLKLNRVSREKKSSMFNEMKEYEK